MNAQIALPFRRKHIHARPNANSDLIGKSYHQDEHIAVTVIGLSTDDPARVVVERDSDGKTWTMPGWLMRLILLEERRRAA